MDILAWIVFGLVLGVIARWIVPGEPPGLLADIAAGILGAAAGGFLYRLFGGGTAAVNLPSMVCAFIGAVVLLWLLRAVRGRSAV